MAKNKMRDNVLIDSDCYMALINLSDADLGKVVRAILKYGFERQETENLDSTLFALYKFATLKMSKSQKRYDASVVNGKKGGAPKGNNNAQKNNLKTTSKNLKTTSNFSGTTSNSQKTTSNFLKTTQNNLKQPKNNPIETEIEIETETEKENASFPYDNKNKNIFYLSDCADQRPKEYPAERRKRYMVDSYEYHKNDDFGQAILLIVDTLLEIEEWNGEQQQIKFNGNTYAREVVADLLATNGKKLVSELAYKIAKDTTIKNKPLYILGSLLAS